MPEAFISGINSSLSSLAGENYINSRTSRRAKEKKKNSTSINEIVNFLDRKGMFESGLGDLKFILWWTYGMNLEFPTQVSNNGIGCTSKTTPRNSEMGLNEKKKRNCKGKTVLT